MKVLIVDDEVLICEWLQFCILQNPVCKLVGTAHNGREALELFQKHEPDLVLTDIKMPVMDGLELLHALRAASGRVRVVMLTAFADFALARQALREGASEYLLKTEMQNETLQELLTRMARELSLDTGDTGLAEASQVHSIVRRILRQEKDLTDADMEELRRCGLQWRDNGLFALAVWKKDMINSGLVFPQKIQMRHVVGFDYSDRIYTAIGNMPRTLSSGEKKRQLAAYAREVQSMNRCMVGMSTVTDEMVHIPALAFQAACSLGQGFYNDEIRLYEPQCTLSGLGELNQKWERELAAMRVRLYQTDTPERRVLTQKFLEYCTAEKILAVDLLIKLCLDIFDLFSLSMQENSALLPETTELRRQLATSVSMRDTSRILLHIAALACPSDQPAHPRSKNISLAAEYIREHYAQPLSLEQVAAQVYLNPEYFSRTFKEEMGQSFVNFLTDVRLRHSVQLLENTALRVQNIAQMVGYSNVSYFSTTFKKKYGMSPYEYRRRTNGAPAAP